MRQWNLQLLAGTHESPGGDDSAGDRLTDIGCQSTTVPARLITAVSGSPSSAARLADRPPGPETLIHNGIGCWSATQNHYLPLSASALTRRARNAPPPPAITTFAIPTPLGISGPVLRRHGKLLLRRVSCRIETYERPLIIHAQSIFAAAHRSSGIAGGMGAATAAGHGGNDRHRGEEQWSPYSGRLYAGGQQGGAL